MHTKHTNKHTKMTAALLLAAGALIACAGCSHQAAPSTTSTVTANPNPVAPSTAANQTLTDPNTSADTKKYLQQHQSQINQGSAPKPAGGQ